MAVSLAGTMVVGGTNALVKVNGVLAGDNVRNGRTLLLAAGLLLRRHFGRWVDADGEARGGRGLSSEMGVVVVAILGECNSQTNECVCRQKNLASQSGP